MKQTKLDKFIQKHTLLNNISEYVSSFNMYNQLELTRADYFNEEFHLDWNDHKALLGNMYDLAPVTTINELLKLNPNNSVLKLTLFLVMSEQWNQIFRLNEMIYTATRLNQENDTIYDWFEAGNYTRNDKYWYGQSKLFDFDEYSWILNRILDNKSIDKILDKTLTFLKALDWKHIAKIFTKLLNDNYSTSISMVDNEEF